MSALLLPNHSIGFIKPYCINIDTPWIDAGTAAVMIDSEAGAGEQRLSGKAIQCYLPQLAST